MKPVRSFLKVPDMNQRTSEEEEVSQQDERTARMMGGEMSTQAYLEELKWPMENLSMQQQQKPSVQDQTQARKRMCAHRSSCGMHRSYHPGDYLAKQPHQCQKYQKNIDRSPGKQQQPSQDSPTMTASSISSSSKAMDVLFRRPSRRNVSFLMENPEPSNTAVGQPSSCWSSTDEANFVENIDEPEQNFPQCNQSQKRAPISKTTDVLSPRPHHYSPQKPKMLYKNTDVIDFDNDLKGLDKKSSYKYMEYAPKLCQSLPHQTNQNIFHKHKQELYQMMSPSREKVGKQQAKHIQLSPPHQYSCILEPHKWGREIGGELLAKNSDILTSPSLSEISEKNCEDSTVKRKRYNKFGRCSDENGTNSTSTRSTVITVKSRDELRSMVRDELCALVQNEIEIHSVFGELSDTVVSHLKDYLCGQSTTDNVPPPKSQYKDSHCTNAPKNSAIDNVLDTKKQESYQTQKKASFGKGIPKDHTQRTSQDLIKEQTQKSYRRASYHKNQKQHSYRTFKLEAKQKQPPNQQLSYFPSFACFSDTPEDDSEESNFEVDKKTLNKLMEGSPKHKLKHTLSGDENDVFSISSSNSVSTSISAKSGNELRAMIWDEMELRSVDVEENVSIFLDLSQPTDDGNQDMKETMSKHPNIASLPNLAIDVDAPTTDSFKGSKTDELPQVECKMSIDDLVNCKVITPMIMKIHNKYMTSMQDAMQLMKYLETVPRLVGQIYKDNITLEKGKL
ncbi:uncharacterized protein [Drosophila pseudoobscura]|uniref:Uncharacterized protein isoform X2 n=1 Tax=Drosophila pseudoobscura pseudoobscura TaxID=46245 RepID=A0A6I8W507_DROPS|nr:uncharacterized protein LOC6901816 isoform X2 [Drosophila pseudoobscura]